MSHIFRFITRGKEVAALMAASKLPVGRSCLFRLERYFNFTSPAASWAPHLTSLDLARSPSAAFPMMDESAKNGEQLLWAYELRLQNVHLHQRLKALDDKVSKQQDRAADSEKESHSAHTARLDELTRQITTLKDGDAAERIAGLTVELRETRQHHELLRDEVKHSEKARKDAESKARKSQAAVDGRLEQLERAVAKIQKTQQGLEARIQEATERAARFPTRELEESCSRHDDQIKAVNEQLRRLQLAQTDLQALFERNREDDHNTPVVPTPSIPPVSERPSKQVFKPATVPVKQGQRKPPARKGKGKAFEKEIAQLIHGGGSLTNAPPVLESQQLSALTTRGQKRRAPEPDDEPSKRFAYTQRETRSQVKKIKEELGVSNSKANEKSAKVAKATNVHQAPKSTAKATRTAKQPAKANKVPARKRPPPATSDKIEVARSREPSIQRQSYDNEGLPNALDAIVSAEQQGQQPQGRRRRVQQDDTEEEFFAKALAIKAEVE